MDFQLITDKVDILKHAPELEKRIKCEEHSFAFLLNNMLIAYGEIACLCDQSLEIKMLEVVEKKRGYGSMFVNYLKAMPGITELWGESLYDAVPFWKKVGAIFDPGSLEEPLCLVNEDGTKEMFPIFFTIQISS